MISETLVAKTESERERELLTHSLSGPGGGNCGYVHFPSCGGETETATLSAHGLTIPCHMTGLHLISSSIHSLGKVVAEARHQPENLGEECLPSWIVLTMHKL